MAKRNAVVGLLQDRLRTHGLFLALGFISLIGFIIATWKIFVDGSLGGFAYPSVILGIGLIFESRIKQVLATVRTKADNITILKIITFVTGMTVLIGGLLTVPFIPYEPGGAVLGAIGYANLIAIFVILYEMFWVK